MYLLRIAKEAFITATALIALGTGGMVILPWPSQTAASSPCQTPTLIVSPNQNATLQQILDEAPPGSVISLKPGIYLVNLHITKDLTLCGSGIQQTHLIGGPSDPRTFLRDEDATLRITGETQAITVTLENFSVTQEGKGYSLHEYALYGGGVAYSGRVTINLRHLKISATRGQGISGATGYFEEDAKIIARLNLQNVEISDNSLSGIIVRSVNTTIAMQDVVIENNGRARQGGLCYGFVSMNPLKVTDSARFDLRNVRIAGHQECPGIFVVGTIRFTAQGLQVSNNSFGISLSGSVNASLADLEISGHEVSGLGVFEGDVGLDEQGSNQFGSPQVTIQRAKIAESEYHGLRIDGKSIVRLEEVIVSDNGKNARCREVGNPSAESKLCNGVVIRHQAQVTFVNATIRGNTDWGVAAWLRKCGYYRDEFSGQIRFEGRNIIEGNNTAHNQQGEVCLP
jgi:hypothetical protein